MRGYLYRHCQPAALLGVFSHEWELRYFVLTGTTLRSYKSDRDASAEPRTVVDVQVGLCGFAWGWLSDAVVPANNAMRTV